MATRFADELRDRFAPVMTADLGTYVDGIGEMFREIEEYARENEGPVYLGPITTAPTPAMIAATGASATDPWWFYYSEGTRGNDFWDTSVTIGGKPTIRVEGFGIDGDHIGEAYANVPVVPGERYVWRGSFKGVPGASYGILFNLFQSVNAGGASTSNSTTVVAKEGITEFSLEVTVPDNRNYGYVYVRSPLAPGVHTFWLSTESHVARKSKSVLPLAPWATITDPESAINEFALLYLAQLAGVRVPQGYAFRDMQTFIERAEARRRGRLDYMVELAQSTLTGNKTVITMERVTSAWTLRILTRTSETPDQDATRAAILRGKPAGIVLDYQAVAGITWDEAVSQWNSATVTWDQSVNTIP